MPLPLPGAGGRGGGGEEPPSNGGHVPLPPSAFAPANDFSSYAGAASGAAATLTPASAGRRTSMDAASPPRGVANASRATLAGEASSSGGDVEAAVPAPLAAIGGLNDHLMEPVPLDSRITLEFADLSTWVPRLFGPGAPGGALTRSATLLKTASTRFGSVIGGASKKGGGGGGGGLPKGEGAQPMRQVRRVAWVRGDGTGARRNGESMRLRSSAAATHAPLHHPPPTSLSPSLSGPLLHLRLLQPGRGAGPDGPIRVRQDHATVHPGRADAQVRSMRERGESGVDGWMGEASPGGACSRFLGGGPTTPHDPRTPSPLTPPPPSFLLSLLPTPLSPQRGATVTGGVLFNGAPMTKRAKRSLGFVLQDDLLYEALTVWETLYYAAMLRLPRTMSTPQKKERVGEVVAALGLAKCRDTIIGGFFRRGISGGERKRVSVGHELLINPSVLLLDEPTSGLDSTTAMRLVTTLRALAAGGRAVATTIHQPSSRLFQLLDKLLLLSEGHAIYYGRAALATDWFHRLGFTMPYGVNAADFLLDVASGDVTGATKGGQGGGGSARTSSAGEGRGGASAGPAASKPLAGEPARRHLIDVYERFAGLHGAEHDGFSESVSLSAAVVGPDAWTAMQSRRSLSDTLPANVYGAATGGAGGGRKASGAGAMPPTDVGPAANGAANGAMANGAAKALAAAQAPPPAPFKKGDRWGASYATQLSILFARAVKTRRFEAMSGQDFAQFMVVGALAGLFWWQIGRDRTVAAAANINGLLFFEMLFLSFRSMFAALFTFPNEHKMMLKERASGMYRLSAFYFARTASDVPMEVTIPTVFIVIIYFMAGLRLSAWAFLANWASVTLCLLVAQSFGLLIGATVMVPKTAQTITAIIMLTMMLVGGFYVTTIPAWIAWLKYLSFVYYGYNLLLKINWVGVELWDCAGSNPPAPAADPRCTAVPPGGLQARLHLQENTEQWPWEALALMAWLVIFRVAVYVALRRKTGARAR